MLTLLTVLGALAASLNGKDVSDYSDHVVVWFSIGPSIYPIIFAAIVARCLKKIACWQAERGTSLGVSMPQLPELSQKLVDNGTQGSGTFDSKLKSGKLCSSGFQSPET